MLHFYSFSFAINSSHAEVEPHLVETSFESIMRDTQLVGQGNEKWSHEVTENSLNLKKISQNRWELRWKMGVFYREKYCKAATNEQVEALIRKIPKGISQLSAYSEKLNPEDLNFLKRLDQDPKLHLLITEHDRLKEKYEGSGYVELLDSEELQSLEEETLERRNQIIKRKQELLGRYKTNLESLFQNIRSKVTTNEQNKIIEYIKNQNTQMYQSQWVRIQTLAGTLKEIQEKSNTDRDEDLESQSLLFKTLKFRIGSSESLFPDLDRRTWENEDDLDPKALYELFMSNPNDYLPWLSPKELFIIKDELHTKLWTLKIDVSRFSKLSLESLEEAQRQRLFIESWQDALIARHDEIGDILRAVPNEVPLFMGEIPKGINVSKLLSPDCRFLNGKSEVEVKIILDPQKTKKKKVALEVEAVKRFEWEMPKLDISESFPLKIKKSLLEYLDTISVLPILESTNQANKDINDEDIQAIKWLLEDEK